MASFHNGLSLIALCNVSLQKIQCSGMQRLCHDMVHPHAREFWLNVKAAIEEAENRAEDDYMLLETGRPIEAINLELPTPKCSIMLAEPESANLVMNIVG